ncbi:hypothetical protein CA51_52830 [Rosistilla oblonga]|nr:hypothetical protein CA51_52830 [Rosistilla oblonga]
MEASEKKVTRRVNESFTLLHAAALGYQRSSEMPLVDVEDRLESRADAAIRSIGISGSTRAVACVSRTRSIPSQLWKNLFVEVHTFD